MTKDEDFKGLVRARMGKTGESYATARRQILAGSPSGTDEISGALAERVAELEAKLTELSETAAQRVGPVSEEEMMHWDPQPGVSRQGGELIFRCSGCGVVARGFASEDTALDALKQHFREARHPGPRVLFTEAGYDTGLWADDPEGS